MKMIDALIATGAFRTRLENKVEVRVRAKINDLQKYIEKGDTYNAAITFGSICGSLTREETEDAKEHINALHDALTSNCDSSKIPDSKVQIEELDLSVRSCGNLKKAGFNTLADLAKITRDQLDTMKNLTKKNRKEIIQTLARHGYEIKDD